MSASLWAGGCACGRIRYTVTGSPAAMLDCQCRQCQRESGTGHASHLAFVDSHWQVEGEATLYDQTGDSGVVKRRAFCQVCGAPLYMTFPAMPNVLVLRAGSLDEPDRYRPTYITWAASAQPWDHLPPGLVRYEGMPAP